MIKKLVRKILYYLLDNFKFIDKETCIGKYTYIGDYTYITKAQIGRYCSIGTEVIIGPGEHILNEISTSSIFYQSNIYQTLTKDDVTIGHDVWIGTRAIILRGVTIGNGAVIGAGAIVTKDIPPFAIVAGVPAKVLKYRFNEDKCRLIEKSQWWLYDKDQAYEIIKQIKSQTE